MSQWHAVAAVDAIEPGSSHELVAGDRLVALFRVGDAFHALDGVCPHQGGPLGKGKLSGCVVTCPWHGWQFDVTDGQHQASRALQHTTLPVKVEDGQVWIET